MHFHQNHCWCSSSNWTNEAYDARYMVSIEENISYQHNRGDNEDGKSDWNSLVYEQDNVWCQEEYDAWVETAKEHPNDGYTEDFLKRVSTKSGVPTLKPDVVDWLNENVKDCASNKEQPQGWAMGNDSYRSKGCMDITIWFYRRRDAMKFIKEWSIHKKPTTYLNYFEDDYRELYEGKLRVYDRSEQNFVPPMKSYDPVAEEEVDDIVITSL